MTLVDELKVLCTYILSVAKSTLPAQLKYDLIFNEDVADKIDGYVSLGTIYEIADGDWEGHEEEVQEYAAAIEKLLADLEKIE